MELLELKHKILDNFSGKQAELDKIIAFPLDLLLL